jgi:two-component system sensor histidine kinase TctE
VTASLSTRLRRRVLVPMAVISLLATAAATMISYTSTSQAFDRAMLDTATAIASRVSEMGGRVELDLTQRELATMLFDRSERTHFAVHRTDGSLVAGEPRIRRATLTRDGGWVFHNQTLDDEPVRVVTVAAGSPAGPFTVTVAETTHERTRWLFQLVGYVLLPHGVLLVVLGSWLHGSINEELTPLQRLQDEVERRATADLRPFEPAPSSKEVNSLAHALSTLMRRIADAVAAQRQFAGNVAHELRTPLAGIRALADYGLAHDEPAVWRRQLEAISTSEERATRLVDQLLAMALADEARDSFEMAPLSLDSLVHDTLLRHLPTADAAGVELSASGLDHRVNIRGHATLLEGALDNLLHNALRHGRPLDGRPSQVSVDLDASGPDVVLTVIDNGPGLSARDRESLKARWSRGAAAAKGARGSGLGLAIVARYAELMEGSLSLDDAPGGGLRAMLHLPRG